MLVVHHPGGYLPERKYIFDVVFAEFLGIPYVLREQTGGEHVRILFGDGRDGKEVTVADVLFQTPPSAWLQPASLPRLPLDRWKPDELAGGYLREAYEAAGMPVIYGKPLPGATFVKQTPDRIDIGIDLFGSAFYMLTRYEEIAAPVRDSLGRYPAEASLAYKERFIERPIVADYTELLFRALQAMWPQMRRKQRRYAVQFSHDVDFPLCAAGRPAGEVLRQAAGDIVKRRTPVVALRRLQSYVQGAFGNLDADAGNTFDFLMSVSEKTGRVSAFYFIADGSAGRIDGDYSLDDPWIRALLRRIHARGHEIGLHPGFDSYNRPERIRNEFQRLLEVCEAENIRQDEWGGRQHYLRWEAPLTWLAWEDAGLDYDSTVGFADRAGFRCGVCDDFPVFHLHLRKKLRLRERPLIAMDQTLLGKRYMNLSYEQAEETIVRLANVCRQAGGRFTLLWHNSQLLHPREMELYRNVAERI